MTKRFGIILVAIVFMPLPGNANLTLQNETKHSHPHDLMTMSEEDNVASCEDASDETFTSMAASPVKILAVGSITKEKGNNICSVLLDTTAGRIKFTYTVIKGITGRDMIKKLTVERVDY